MQEHVCDRWGTQTTAIDFASQNSEVTVPPHGEGGGGGGLHKALVVGCVSLWRRQLASRP